MNPETGSFISRDTYNGDYNSPITLHKYLYANANPITYSDPSGYMGTMAGTLTATSIMAESRAQHDTVVMSIGIRLIAKAKAIVTLMSLTVVPGTFLVSCIVGDVLSGVAQGGIEADDSASSVRDEIISNAIDDAISFAINYATSVATAAVIAASKAKLNQQSKDYYVYLGIDNGKPIYVGITNDVPRREAEHGSRFSDGLDQLNTVPLTRNQARAVEQVIIERNPFFRDIINNPKGNKINSISKYNILYVAAIPYGTLFVETNPIYQEYKNKGDVN